MNEVVSIKYWNAGDERFFVPANVSRECIEISDEFILLMQSLTGREYERFKFGLVLNLFYWHLAKFDQDDDPVPDFMILMRNAFNFIAGHANANFNKHVDQKFVQKKKERLQKFMEKVEKF